MSKSVLVPLRLRTRPGRRSADRCRVECEVDRPAREYPHSLGHDVASTGDFGAGGAQGVGVRLAGIGHDPCPALTAICTAVYPTVEPAPMHKHKHGGCAAIAAKTARPSDSPHATSRRRQEQLEPHVGAAEGTSSGSRLVLPPINPGKRAAG